MILPEKVSLPIPEILIAYILFQFFKPFLRHSYASSNKDENFLFKSICLCRQVVAATAMIPDICLATTYTALTRPARELYYHPTNLLAIKDNY